MGTSTNAGPGPGTGADQAPRGQPRDRAEPQKPKFERDPGFYKELKRRVDSYFEATGLRRRDSPQMYAKTAVILLWFGASYALLVFAARTWWQGVGLAASLALSIAGIGFSIQHDANHGS